MIVPFIMRSEPSAAKSARQTASFVNDSGLRQTVELRRSEELIFEDFVGELMIAYVFDLPSYFQHVNRKDCLDFGIKHDELRALSARNLVRRRPKPTVKPGQTGVMFVMDQNLESSLLLVDLVWDQVERQFPGETVAAVPARDVILVTGADVPGGIESLERAIDRTWKNSEPRLLLTRSLLVRRDKSWRIFGGS
jgi:uncharacterized protein YtpQ (UPF0354 family)